MRAMQCRHKRNESNCNRLRSLRRAGRQGWTVGIVEAKEMLREKAVIEIV